MTKSILEQLDEAESVARAAGAIDESLEAFEADERLSILLTHDNIRALIDVAKAARWVQQTKDLQEALSKLNGGSE